MNDQKNLANLGDGINCEHHSLIDAHNKVMVENPVDGALRRQPPIPFPQEFYRGNINITHSDGTLVIPPLLQDHTFVVTTSLMQMLTARGLSSRLPFEYAHAHIAKLRSICKSCLGRPD